MATSEADVTVVGGSEELPPHEEAAGEQKNETPDRRHVDALLDISEEEFLKYLEPHEYHCCSGWEEAVRGWTRVAPLSCVLLSQKGYKKANDKMSTDPPFPKAESSASVKTSAQLNQHTGSCSSSTGAAHLQKDASQWLILNQMQRTMSPLSLGEDTEDHGELRETHVENRPTKCQSSNTAVPLRHFTFLPPIATPHSNPQVVSGEFWGGKKALEGKNTKGKCFGLDKKSRTRGIRAGTVVNRGLVCRSALKVPDMPE